MAHWRHSEQRPQVFCDLLGRGLRWVSLDDIASSIDEELLEVPRDIRAVALLSLQPPVEIACTVTVDIDLGEQWEIDGVLAGRELEDLGVSAGFLGAELVARESQDREALRRVVFVERTQTCVLRRQASSAGDVDDQTDRVSVVDEINGLTRDRRHRDVIHVRHTRTLTLTADHGWFCWCCFTTSASSAGLRV